MLLERMVFGFHCVRDTPVALALAGGYVGQNLSQKGLTSLHWTIQAKLELEGKLLRKYG